METKGIILYNCGTKCLCRSIVCLYSLRKYYKDDITFFIEQDTTPAEFDEVCKYFNVNIIKLPSDPTTGALIKKTKTLWDTPYDKTLWIDADVVVVGKIDEMFSYLDDTHTFAIPHFCSWYSDGGKISKRIKRFKGIVEDEMLNEALNHYPAINTGVFSYKKQTDFLRSWITLSIKTNGKRIFISDEISAQVLLPQFKDEICVTDPKFNVSVLYGNDIEDKRCIHFHGSKSVLNVPLCDIFKSTFEEMRKDNIANINHFLKYADKRLAQYLEKQNNPNMIENNNLNKDVTIVTAIDNFYCPILEATYSNWQKYKNIDSFPVIVYVNEIPLDDKRLDFLRLPNVRIIPWEMKKAETHREEMLSSFVFGPSKNVQTEFWMKLDADSYATDYRPLVEPFMKKYDSFIGQKWSYSRPIHIQQLDNWGKTHWQRKLKNFSPMINQGKIEGNRFYHNVKRTISFIQLHKTKFSRFCVKLIGEGNRLPCPSQDTTLFYIAQVFNPSSMATHNFKKHQGFTQGRGKMGAEHIKKCLEQVDLLNASNNNSIKADISLLIESDQEEKEDLQENDKNEIDNVVKMHIGSRNEDYIVEIINK